MSEPMTRDQFQDILAQLGEVTHATKNHLEQLAGLEVIMNSRITDGWWDEFEAELSSLQEMFDTQIIAEAIGKRMGGEPLEPSRLVELASTILTLHTTVLNRTQEDSEELFGAMLLFERNVTRPDVVHLMLSHENKLSAHELVELALQEPLDTPAICMPGAIDEQWVANHSLT